MACADLPALIDMIYGAALDEALWPGVLAALAGIFGAHQATLYSHDPSSGAGAIHAEFGIEPGFRSSYVEHFAALNPFAPAVARLEPGSSATADDLLDRQSYRRSEFFADWVRPQGCAEFITASLDRRFGSITGVTVLRDARRFGAGERALYDAVLPHLRRALAIRRRLGSAAARAGALEAALDRVGVGVAVVAADAQIVFANAAAERALSARRGLSLRARRIGAEVPDAEAALRRAVHRAAAGNGTTGDTVTVPGRDGGGAFPLLICPLSAPAPAVGGAGPRALVVFGGEGRGAVRRDELAQAFDLTPAEAGLLSALVAGASLADHAAANALSRETVRSQLRGVLAKTGTRRQIDAIRRVLADPVLSRP